MTYNSFINVSFIQAVDPDNKPVYYNAEELLVGYKDNFTKWSNNAGKFLSQIIIISSIFVCLTIGIRIAN